MSRDAHAQICRLVHESFYCSRILLGFRSCQSLPRRIIFNRIHGTRHEPWPQKAPTWADIKSLLSLMISTDRFTLLHHPLLINSRF